MVAGPARTVAGALRQQGGEARAATNPGVWVTATPRCERPRGATEGNGDGRIPPLRRSRARKIFALHVRLPHPVLARLAPSCRPTADPQTPASCPHPRMRRARRAGFDRGKRTCAALTTTLRVPALFMTIRSIELERGLAMVRTVSAPTLNRSVAMAARRPQGAC